MTDTKHYITLPSGYANVYKTYEEAEDRAKRNLGDKRQGTYDSYVIYEAVSIAKQPVPDVEVKKLLAETSK